MLNLQQHCDENELDIIILNETWLHPDISDALILPKYTIFRKDRRLRGGGVLIAVKKSIKAHPIIFDNLDFEVLAVKCQFKDVSCIIWTWYNPPSSNLGLEVSHLFQNLKLILHEADFCLFAGDVNCDKISDPNFRNLKDQFEFLGMEVLETIPTYPAKQPSRFLDWFAISDYSFLSSLKVINNIHENCDHLAFEATFEILRQKASKSKFVKIFTKNSFKNINSKLSEIDWHTRFSDGRNINLLFDCIEREVSEIVESEKVIKKVVLKKRIPKVIRKLIVRRRKSKNHSSFAKLTKQIGNLLDEFENAKIKKLIKKNKTSFDLFKYIKKVNKPSSVKTFIDAQGLLIDDVVEITKSFNSNFSSHFTNSSALSKFEDIQNLKNHHLLDQITMNDILNVLKKFNYKKSEGKTFIPNIVIKNCQNGICKLLYFLFNQICENNKIPDKMKIAKITPILKNGKNKHDISSYRGVSVMMNIMKILEMILRNKFYLCLFYEQFTFKKQYGFTKGISLFHQLLDVQKEIFTGLRDKNCKAVDAIFLDFSNAFDTINHRALFEKFLKNGFDQKLFDIFVDMFTNRKQEVSYLGCVSNSVNVTSGVLQGSVLAADFYKYYVNDISENIISAIFMWADDTVMIRKIYSESDIQILQNDLKSIEIYSVQNSLKLNPAKSVHLRFSTKDCGSLSSYSIGSSIIEIKREHKHLGVILDVNFSFNSHVDAIISKAFKQFNALKYVSKRMDGWTIRDLYKCYVLPVIEYSNMSWF